MFLQGELKLPVPVKKIFGLLDLIQAVIQYGLKHWAELKTTREFQFSKPMMTNRS